MTKPIISDDAMYCLLREGKITEFNTRHAQGGMVVFECLDFRGLDLRGMHAKNVVFSNCYFRQADLRGVDLSTCRLQGASVYNAKISGVLFPKQLGAQEVVMSLTHGTRMRY